MTASNPADRRMVLAFAAFVVAVAICVHQRHFTLSLTHPETFSHMLRHRCGDLLALTAAWAACECFLARMRRTQVRSLKF